MSRFWLFLIGLLFGLGAGLYVGWVISPVEYVDAAPASLTQADKDEWVLLLATRYAGEGDLLAVEAGLQTLGVTDSGLAVAATAERFISAGQVPEDIRRVVALAAALGTTTPAMQSYLP